MSADQRGTRKALGLIEGQHVTISRNGRTVTGAVKVDGGNSWSVGDRRFGGATIVTLGSMITFEPTGKFTRDTLIKVDGAVVGVIHSRGPRSMTYRVSILLPTFKEATNVFGYANAVDRAIAMVLA